MKDDPYTHHLEDPTGITFWLASKGHAGVTVVPLPEMRHCRLPSCNTVIDHHQLSAVYCCRSHKEEHVNIKRKAKTQENDR